jgi:hypothetical protein
MADEVVVVLRRLLARLAPDPQLEALSKRLEQQSPFNPLRLYRQVSRRPEHVSDEECLRVQHPKLLSLLRPYQVRAVLWAMNAERNGLAQLQPFLDRAWKEMHVHAAALPPDVLLNPLTGQVLVLVFCFPIVKSFFCRCFIGRVHRSRAPRGFARASWPTKWA